MTLRPLASWLRRLIWLSLLPITLFSIGLAISHVLSVHEELRMTANRRVKVYAAQIDGFLEARLQALELLAASPLVDTPAHWPELYAQGLVFQRIYGSHLIFADSERQMLFNTRAPYGVELPRLPDVPKGRSAALLALTTGKATVGDRVRGPVIGEDLVAIAVPVLRNGRVRYLLLAATTIAQLGQHLAALPIAPGWALTIHDGAGQVIARHAPAGFDPATEADEAWRFSLPSRVSSWTVTLEVAPNIVREPLLTGALALFAGLTLALSMGLFAAHHLAERISREVGGLGERTPPTEQTGIAEIAAVCERLLTQQAEIWRLAELVEQSPLVAIVWRNAPGWPVEFVSDNIVRWGLDKQALLSGRLHYADLIHPDDLPAIEDDVARHLAHGPDRYLQEYRLRDGFGHWRWIEDHTWLERDESGQVRSIRGVLLDVSSRFEAEAKLREKSAELAARNAELERFAEAAIGRELEMLRLKQEINALSTALGKPPPFTLPHLDDTPPSP